MSSEGQPDKDTERSPADQRRADGEDLILAAIKDAQSKASDKAQEEMGKLTEGMGLPKDMKLPF